MTFRPFLSHQWSDKPLVRRIAEGLIEIGMDPILDVWEFVPGDSLTKSMNKGLKSASAFVLFWSKHSARSDNVEYEREIGLVEMKKRDDFRVICVILDDTPPPTEHSFRLYINWQRGKRRGKSFGRNLAQLCRAIQGQPIEERPSGQVAEPANDPRQTRFVYASDFGALKSAMAVVNNCVDSGPHESPAGPYFTARVDPETESALVGLKSVWVYRKPHHESDAATRKFLYVVHTSDIPKLEAIIGSIEDAPNWEATSLGMYIEADMRPKQVVELQSLSSVTVFDEPQHTLTDDDRAVHERWQWSKRAGDAAISNITFESVDAFAVALAKEFETICLVDLTLDNVDTAVGERSYSVCLFMSHDNDVMPQQGSGTANLNDMIENMKTFVAQDRGVDANQIDSEMQPLMCTNGMVITVTYTW